MTDDPFSAMNFFAGFGYLSDDAQFFLTRSQRPKITFRLRIPRSANMPQRIFCGSVYGVRRHRATNGVNSRLINTVVENNLKCEAA